MGTKGYLFGQGIDNLKKHGGKTFSTMLIICATMLLLGVFLIIYINVDINAKVITENQGLQAFISDDVLESNIDELEQKIKAIGNIKSVTYLNKDAAFNDAKETLKEYDYLLEGLETVNPFPRSFIIVFENLEDSKAVKEAVESVDGIYRVSYNEAIISAVTSASSVGSIVIIAIGLIMIIVSIFIISNTIKLSVYSNKREIYIMKYVGATTSFIKAPFVISGMLIGIGSAVFSWVVISMVYIGLYSKVPQLGSQIGTFGLVPYSYFWYYILIAFAFAGIMLGGIGSSIATHKYLKEFKPVKISLNEKKKQEAQERMQKREEEERKKQEKIQANQLNKQEKESKKEIKEEKSKLDVGSLSRKEARRRGKI